jgi:hypothetical protein
MTEFVDDVAPLGEIETSLLAESLCNLWALAAADGIPPRRLKPELQIEALLAFCRENLHDADLSPQQAADHLWHLCQDPPFAFSADRPVIRSLAARKQTSGLRHCTA